jgi:sugar phosphate isomerase/epimerase
MKLSSSTCLSEWILRDTSRLYYTCEQSLASIRRAGFEAADLNFASYSRPGEPMTKDDWQTWTSRILETAGALGLPLTQSHAYFWDTKGRAPEEGDEGMALLRRSLTAARRMHIPVIAVHPISVSGENGYSCARSLAANRELLLRCQEWCGPDGPRIAVENMVPAQDGLRFGVLPEHLLNLLDALNDPSFGICWDFGHAHLAGLSQPDALALTGSRLIALHVNDNLGDRDMHFSPYQGTIDWSSAMRALKKTGYEGDLTFEVIATPYSYPAALHDDVLKLIRRTGEYLLTL